MACKFLRRSSAYPITLVSGWFSSCARDPASSPSVETRVRWAISWRRFWTSSSATHPRRRPAAQFFLSDVYYDHDFSRRDADIARVLPMMQRLLPSALLSTVADAIELGLLTHAFDLRMAQRLQTLAPRRRRLDAALPELGVVLVDVLDHQVDHDADAGLVALDVGFAIGLGEGELAAPHDGDQQSGQLAAVDPALHPL